MPQKDNRISDYIARAEDFAQPILNNLRSVIHETCPGVRETIKWGVPHFEYSGSILCSMAAFKKHCAFGFWLGSMIKVPENLPAEQAAKTGMGDFGKLKRVGDLPAKKTLKEFIRQAMELNERGIKRPKLVTSAQADTLVVPDYFLQALKKNKKAATAFEKFSYSHRKEYVEWIAEAKTEQTRNKRMASALEWLAEEKRRNWKYEKR